jgi:hypothetical protein
VERPFPGQKAHQPADPHELQETLDFIHEAIDNFEELNH